jgi:hypothetical protein
MTASRLKAKTFKVRIEDRGGLFVATSPDIQGMLVVENSLEALRLAIPSEVADLFAACGLDVVVTEIDGGEGDERPWVAVSADFARTALSESDARAARYRA